MAIYSDLPKLGRTKTPAGNVYALIDTDGRAIIAPNFSASAETTYGIGDHVIYQDNLYRAKEATTGGTFVSSKWDLITVDSEIKRLEGIMAGGIHYRGKTTTPLYDGASTNPITIDGSPYTADSGDLVLLDLTIASVYAAGSAYAIHTYIVHAGDYYITSEAIAARDNIDFESIEDKLDKITSEPEFLFDGTTWAGLGAIGTGLGELAYKDSATGTYIKPSGTGSVTIRKYTTSTKSLSTTTVTGTNGTVDTTKITQVTSDTFAKAGAEVVYGTADVDEAVQVGTSLTGTTTFNTDAIKDASLIGTRTFTIAGVTASVNGDCLELTSAETGTVNITTTPASTASVGLGKESITPAKAADSTRKLTPVGSTGSVVTGVTYETVSPAKVADAPTTVATGGLESGDALVTGLLGGTETAVVTVNTTTDEVTVK